MSGTEGTIVTMSDVAVSEPEKVANWRAKVALDNGADTVTAEMIGRITEIDLHEWVGMVKAGCEPATAFRILAPLA